MIMMTFICDEGLDLLRVAIVTRAAKDYIKLKKKKKLTEDELSKLEELEEFFRSQYFEWLVNCDGEYIMNEIEI